MPDKKAQGPKVKGTTDKAKNPERFSQIDKGPAGQSPASYAQNYARQKRLNELKREERNLRLRLGAEKMLAKAAMKSMGVNGFLAKRGIKRLNKKPTNRLSGDNEHRILVLILIALIFDTLQLALGVFELVPIIGIIFIPLQWLILLLSFFVFFFFWRHYEVSFIERTIGKKFGSPALKYAQVALIFILPIAEIIPIFPGITLKTTITILLVRSMDKHRANEEKLKQIREEIIQLNISQ